MDWQDTGIVLSARPFGENGAVLSVLTESHGRHAGLLHGARGTKRRALAEPGHLLALSWRARLDDHLGTFAVESLAAHAAGLFDAPLRLTALCAACALIDLSLAEREPHPELYRASMAWLEALPEAVTDETWLAAYIRWELILLAELGFGLDLQCCAATGSNDDLVYVSPRTGRAVSASAGEPYRDRLLVLPAFLHNEVEPTPTDLADGLKLTGYFLEHYVFTALGRAIPAPRLALAAKLITA